MDLHDGGIQIVKVLNRGGAAGFADIRMDHIASRKRARFRNPVIPKLLLLFLERVLLPNTG
jgi:hypothetical protein